MFSFTNLKRKLGAIEMEIDTKTEELNDLETFFLNSLKLAESRKELEGEKNLLEQLLFKSLKFDIQMLQIKIKNLQKKYFFMKQDLEQSKLQLHGLHHTRKQITLKLNHFSMAVSRIEKLQFMIKAMDTTIFNLNANKNNLSKKLATSMKFEKYFNNTLATSKLESQLTKSVDALKDGRNFQQALIKRHLQQSLPLSGEEIQSLTTELNEVNCEIAALINRLNIQYEDYAVDSSHKLQSAKISHKPNIYLLFPPNTNQQAHDENSNNCRKPNFWFKIKN